MNINKTSGAMKATGNGTATITAKATDGSGKSASCRVIGTVLIDKMWFEISPYVINAGWSVNQGFWYTPDNAKSTAVTWSSGNKQVATVSSDGTVWSNYNWFGTATITAKAKDGGGAWASYVVDVRFIRMDWARIYNPPGRSLNVGEGYGLGVEYGFTGDEASYPHFSWSSSDTSVATVNGGWVTAKKAGTVTITAYAQDGSGCTASCTINVVGSSSGGGGSSKASVTGVTLNVTQKTMYKGYTYHLTATVSPSDAANKKVTWSSSNTKILTVEEKTGEIKAKAKGSATITVKTKDGGKTASCKVTVTDAPKGSIKITTLNLASTSRLELGKTKTIYYLISPTNASHQVVTWKSDNENIATVDSKSGNVTAKSTGTVKITATAADNSGVEETCLLTVYATKLKSIEIKDIEVEQGQTKNLNITYNPSDASKKKLNYKSETAGIASVSEYGAVTGKKEGKTLITASATDGSGVSTQFVVTVVPKTIRAERVLLDKSVITVDHGTETNLTATVKPDNALNKGVTWESSDQNIVSINPSGSSCKITAVGAGTATIKVTTKDGGKTATCKVTVPVSVSYIFYLPEWYDEAVFDQARLAERLYGGDTGRVILIEVVTVDDFTTAWNDMRRIDTVVIDVHASPTMLQGFGNLRIADIEQLNSKTINNLIIYGCNAGHSDYEGENVANAFSGRIGGASVFASDGTVYSDTSRTTDEPYESRADDEWRDWKDRVNPSRADNNGWLLDQRNIGTKWLTLLQMLDHA